MVQPSVHQLYQRLETIGKGGYGSVHKGVHIPTGKVVALKIINLDTPDDDVADIQREVTLLSQLRDAPNITEYYGCYMDGPRVWIVMEYAQGGSVDALMKASEDGCLEEKYVSVIVREVLVGLSYLHKVPVIHRDMKAANILVTSSGKVMICDFGVSALLPTSTSKRNTLTGTPYWMAPEVVQSVAAYDTKADIWSLGILVYEMVKGSPPHSNLDRFQVMELIPKVKPPRLAENEGSKDMRDFVAFCLKELASERLSADELLKTRWIKSVSKVNQAILKDLIFRLNQIGPRASLAGSLDWEKEEKDAIAGNDDDWEFETIRGYPPPTHSQEDGQDLPNFTIQHQNVDPQTTVRPSQPTSALPTSLRVLFEDNFNSQKELEPLRSFGTKDTAPSSPTSPSENSTTSTSFAPSPRLTTHNSTRVDNDTPTPRNGIDAAKTQQYPNHPSSEPLKESTAPAITSLTESPKPSPSLKGLRVQRQRSQSNTETLTNRHHDRDLASPAAFRFPAGLRSEGSTLPQVVDESGIKPVASDAGKFIDYNASSSSHQNARSLDTTTSRRTPLPPVMPPPMSRVRSATAIPSSRPDDTISILQHHRTTPSARSHLDRYTPETIYHPARPLGTPGLKDVLKVPLISSEYHLGFTDLLPPSPSVAHQPRIQMPQYIGSTDTSRPASSIRPPLDRDSLVPNSAPPHQFTSSNDLRTPASLTPRTTNLSVLQPLDYAALTNIRGDQLHDEAIKAIEQLNRWLGIVENGLTSLMHTPIDATIDTIQKESTMKTDDSTNILESD